ncbi:hypothetical protein [Streptomyces sp. NPDC002328]|uniref:hypothetical protein n=1 Tax=Streptomyces sp. NPDC002328 TaxID=3364642 RepID=UPI0036CED8A0
MRFAGGDLALEAGDQVFGVGPGLLAGPFGEPVGSGQKGRREDRAEALKITVPETGLPNGLKPGLPVMPVELFATPWARIFNGQLSDGIAYRADRVDLVGGPAPAADAA